MAAVADLPEQTGHKFGSHVDTGNAGAYVGCMHLRAFVAVIGLLGGCASHPDPTDHTAEVEPAPYSVQHGPQFKVVDDGSTYMRQLLEHVVIEPIAGIASESIAGRVHLVFRADYGGSRALVAMRR